MRKLYLIILLIFTNFFSLWAIEGLRFENITHKDGLSHNTVRCIMQDSRGFMWISTTNGLNRYDGYKFIAMYPKAGISSLTENNIRQTTDDRNGRIWIHTTSRVVNCYDTRTESFVDFTGKPESRIYRKLDISFDGNIWLYGIENGACYIRYINGEAVPVIYDINNIGTNVVNFVLEDSSGQVWLGTDKGLLQIINGIPKYGNTGNVSYNYHSVIEQKERIYFFTNNGQILVFDKSRKVFLPNINIAEGKTIALNQTVALSNKHILITGKQATLILDTEVGKVAEASFVFNGEVLKETNVLTDNKNNCWIYNKSGNVWRYRKDLQRFEKFDLIPRPIMATIDLERYDIYCDSRGITWITTFGNGLFAIEEDGNVSHFTADSSGLRTNYLLSVAEDRSGDIWIGTEHTGISKISLTKYKHQVFLPDPQRTGDSKTIRSIYEDKKNKDIWIGTKSGDLYIFDKNLKRKSILPLPQGVPYSITTDTIGNVWIGTKGNGLMVFPKGKTTLNDAYSHLLTDDDKTGGNNIYSVLRDNKGRMWIGTFGQGVFLCEQHNDKFEVTTFPRFSNKQKQVRCMIQDSSGLIWTGGENGIVVFDPDSLIKDDSQFDWFHFDKSDPQSLNNNVVKVIYEDSMNRIWIGTSGGGLNLTVKNEKEDIITFKHYTSEEGLVNNVVQTILEDEKKNLWISTESGISKFSFNGDFFENYNFLDTWESDLFCEAASLKRENGELLFGSYNGMYIFNPALFESQSIALPVTITGFSINGIPVTPNSSDSPLIQSITETKSIRLRNGQNSFSIEFSSLNFQTSYSHRYTYILENYDKEWNPITQYNIATYKNIPAGKYVFKVRTCNSSGNWDSLETELEIIVIPPFWKSTKALILYFILLIVIGFFAIKLIIKMNKLHNQVEIEKQLTEFRLRFFTNISHEFRTPLTIIRGSIESMNTMKSLPAPLKKHIHTLSKSSSKLMHLIDQLLEFRKMQNNMMDLRLEYIEVIEFLKGIYEMFLETANRKQINFTFSSDEQSRIILLDKGKIEKIAFNLLSNAFKHTPEGGHIDLRIIFDDVEELFILKVADSGVGIPPEKRDLLFVRFKQINYSSAGMGIGLHLSAEFTNIHKGEITYSDSEWGGACFTVSIPTSDAYDQKDIVIPNPTSIMSNTHIEEDESREEAELNIEKEKTSEKYKILIIEDDEEISLFLEDHLKRSFTTITASNGLIGLEKAINEQPNLIVCDVMMPEMDGFEVTRRVKSDFQSSHIPIILLTAHSSIEHQLEGINAGADSYIIKPFSTQYLISRIIKLIEQREKLQYKFAHEPGMIQTTICTTNRDNEFIDKMHGIIEKHLDDPDFTIDDFAQTANMGRTIFYKKIKGITNYSPNEYLRIIRLKKATELLRTTDLNVAEVAYKVGFNDPFYFSKCFKEQFGMRPTQFRDEENKKMNMR